MDSSEVVSLPNTTSGLTGAPTTTILLTDETRVRPDTWSQEDPATPRPDGDDTVGGRGLTFS